MSAHKPLALLASRRLGPLFVTQFLGAANDNLFKNALIVLAVYRLAGGASPAVLGTLAAAAFILPFFLFSAAAGQLADAGDKAVLIRRVKAAEIAVMLAAALCLAWGNVWALLAVLFLLGTQASFFGPVKYAILPDHLGPADLLLGNSLIEAGTFVAILLGTIGGGLLALAPAGELVVGAVLVAVAVGGWASSRLVPPAPPAVAGVRPDLRVVAGTRAVLAGARRDRAIFGAILGISWFWLVGATYLTEFAAFTRAVLNADNHVVTLFLTLFSLGVGLGSLAAARLLKGEVSARHVPAAALVITLFSLDFALAGPAAAVPGPALGGIADLLARPAGWRVVADLMLVSLAGGVYAVPLYALLQARADEAERARTVAANNVFNALFMTIGAAATAGLLAAGLSLPGVFCLLAAANGVVAMLSLGWLAEAVLKRGVAGALRLAFRVRLRGDEHAAALAGPAVVVANHTSLLDAVLLAAFLPGRPIFAVDTGVAGWWWVGPVLRLAETFTLDPANPMAIRTLARAVEAGRVVVIFPEGRITVTGGLMKVYDGPAMIADRTGAPVLPVRIDGPQYSLLSYLSGKLRRRLFPPVTLTVLPPRRLEVPLGLRGRARRRAAGEQLYDLMAGMMAATADLDRTLPQALADAIAAYGGRHPALVEEGRRRPVGLRRLAVAALTLSRVLAAGTAPGEAVGLLLPNAVAAAAALLAVQMAGRVPAMLNPAAGEAGLAAAFALSRLRRVVTSRRFLAAARLDAAHLTTMVELVYLEDLTAAITRRDRLAAVAALASFGRRGGNPDAPAVILFTSGSEGAPKGVVLSHRNLLANGSQMAAVIDVTPADSVFAALPLFHAFGLLGGLVLPLLLGVKSFLYPNPLHYHRVPELIYASGATILFGTDTFLAAYGKAAHSLDFRSLRCVFAGAEKVRGETRSLWAERFGLRLLEGYGATETAPVLAVNTPTHYRPGTVGRFLPGIEWRLAPVEGVEAGGRLAVRGPNVMLGYLRAERPGSVQAPPDGWYDTGDIVSVDGDGYVTVHGRARRFAKVAGEMVSLAAVEEALTVLWPGYGHAVMALSDPRRGERLVLVTTRPDTDRAAVAAGLAEAGLPPLAVPREVRVRARLPRLASGKVDYPQLERDIAEPDRP